MRKTILIFIFTLLGVLSAQAYDFLFHNIYYHITDTDQVSVIYPPSSSGNQNNIYSYLKSVVIPATVEYDGTTYAVRYRRLCFFRL